MNKKTKIAIIAVIALVLVTIGITYAYWLITRTQEGENVITTGCLDITIDGEDDITLTDQFPLSDEDGMKLTPYTFTVTNNCNTSVDYQVALEATGDESTAIASSALKVSLNDTIKLYSAYSDVTPTVSGAYESRAIGYSRLAAKGSEGSTDSYELRIWIDEDADVSEMNKIFQSKITVTIGQGFESPYEEGTLAYDILANYGGVSTANEIDSTTFAHRVVINTDKYMSTSSNLYFGTDYTYNNETGKYKLSGSLTQATLTECRNGKKSDGTEITCGKYTLYGSSADATFSHIYEIVDFLASGSNINVNYIEYTNGFGIGSANDSSLSKTQDDLGNSYYFRGVPTDNYVEFGTYLEDDMGYKAGEYAVFNSLEECLAGANVSYPADEVECTPTSGGKKNDKMYWRIVRINGDGTIRLIYDGTELVKNGITHNNIIAKSAYNSKYNDVKYISYTYDDGTGKQVDSTVKSIIDTWYTKHLKTNYGSYLADTVFCNDKSLGIDTTEDTTYYGASSRLKTPSLSCFDKNDRYTVEDTQMGNGFLSNPIGMLTADEVLMSGSLFNSNYGIRSYLNSGNTTYEDFWTLSPYYSYSSDGHLIFTSSESGNLSYMEISADTVGVRPVINLKADVEFTGKGTIDSPYKIVME